MRRKAIFSAIATIAFIVMIVGCKNDEDSVLNKITVSGNTTAGYNQDYISLEGHYNGPYQVQCVTTTYGSYIWIDLSSNAVLHIQMILPSNAVALPEGTLSPSPEECAGGFLAIFYPDYYGTKIEGLLLPSGTVTIKKAGSVYSIDVNLGVDASSGGGFLKGNFYGE